MNITAINEATEHIIVTANTNEIRAAIHKAYDEKGCELVNSSPTSILWRWYNASASDLAAIAEIQGYKGTTTV